MKFEPTPLGGLILVYPQLFNDSRGFFYESFNAEKFRAAGIDLPWVQDNHALSTRGTVRGLHFQRGPGQAKLVRCTRGRVWDVAVDIRPGSPTRGRWFAHELSGENKVMMFIPAGFAHGYAVLSDEAEFIYKCSTLYNGALEAGFCWNDPEVGIPWPVADPVLSARDQNAPSFRECLASLNEDLEPTR